MDRAAEDLTRMVEHLRSQGFLRTDRVAGAMARVRRDLFLPGQEDLAFADRPQGIGRGQTISAPHMVAMMAEALDLAPGMKVLEVGTGSGYHAAIAAELVAPGGTVWSVERFPDLAAQARANLRHAGYAEDRVRIAVGDGSEGLPRDAPFDRIYLTCAAPAVPAPLLGQLAPEGKLLAPVGTRTEQELLLVERTPQGSVRRSLGGCVFVPLVGKHGFPDPSTN